MNKYDKIPRFLPHKKSFIKQQDDVENVRKIKVPRAAHWEADKRMDSRHISQCTIYWYWWHKGGEKVSVTL